MRGKGRGRELWRGRPRWDDFNGLVGVEVRVQDARANVLFGSRGETQHGTDPSGPSRLDRERLFHVRERGIVRIEEVKLGMLLLLLLLQLKSRVRVSLLMSGLIDMRNRELALARC